MSEANRTTVSFVVCLDPSGYEASLEKHRIYPAVNDSAAGDGDLRVIDESGESYLYYAERFVPIDVPEEVGRSIVEDTNSW